MNSSCKADGKPTPKRKQAPAFGPSSNPRRGLQLRRKRTELPNGQDALARDATLVKEGSVPLENRKDRPDADRGRVGVSIPQKRLQCLSVAAPLSTDNEPLLLVWRASVELRGRREGLLVPTDWKPVDDLDTERAIRFEDGPTRTAATLLETCKLDASWSRLLP